ncbi:MAG: hypothetical protein JSV42_07660 [Chloroflexota bacterium]|nr:MAG: hypothetical protein JSV42_07660 [Chloroflexota bacterium]
MYTLYEWVKFLHVIASVTFMVSHGASIAISFRLKGESDMDKVKTMLDLSGTMWVAMMLSLVVAAIAGVVLGFMLRWWSQWWIWISTVLLLVITIWMFTIGQGTFHKLRKALGMPYQAGGREMPAEEPAPVEESKALIAKTRPHLMLLVGYGGFVVIIWLMMFKPF